MGLDTIPKGIKSARDVAETCRLSEGRLTELADAGLIPHFRIDGVAYFDPAEARIWIAGNLLSRCDGAASLIVRVNAPLPPPVTLIPKALSEICGLRELFLWRFEPAVYFLCKGDAVVYVGQSTDPSARVSSHLASGKKFDAVFLLPCPSSELDRVESEFIHALKPPLNGRLSNGALCAPLPPGDK